MSSVRTGQLSGIRPKPADSSATGESARARFKKSNNGWNIRRSENIRRLNDAIIIKSLNHRKFPQARNAITWFTLSIKCLVTIRHERYYYKRFKLSLRLNHDFEASDW